MRIILALLLLAGATALPLGARQVRTFPYHETFEGAVVPALPPGWTTSTARAASGDFATTHSAPNGDSTAVLSTNALIAQWIAAPPFDLRSWRPESLTFFERRSATHTSGVLVEASTDGGASFGLPLSDTLRNPGTTAYVRRALALPPLLGTVVTIRWRVAGGSGGTSATYRLDDIVLSARGRIDLAVAAMALIPALPVTGDSVGVAVTVRNVGLDDVAGGSLLVAVDRDHDLRADSAEVAARRELASPLAPGEAETVVVMLPGSAVPADTLLAVVAAPLDQNPGNDLRALRRTTGPPHGAVVISEIMRAPLAPSPEWVEIASSAAETVDVASWGLRDRTATSAYRLSALPRPLPPGGRVVLTRDSVQFAAAWPDALPPAVVPGMPLSLFNNDSDAVVLVDHRGAVLDSVHYGARWGGGGGISLERVEPTGPSLDSANWGASGDPRGGTPGEANWLTPLDTNVRAWRLFPVTDGDSVAAVAFTVRNTGRATVASFSALLHRTDGADPVASAGSTAALAHGDSGTILFPVAGLPPGAVELRATVVAAGDGRAADDTVRATIVLSSPRNALTVNEIMYAPLPGMAEYVEYVNAGRRDVDVRGWSLAPHRTPGRTTSWVEVPTVIAPGAFLVFAADSSLFGRYPEAEPAARVVVRNRGLGLGDAGDTLLLLDRSGRVIDSLVYDPAWHNPDLDETRGRSLERISPLLDGHDRRNWNTSADAAGGTPGRRNSLAAGAAAARAGVEAAPNPFSPDGDGAEDQALLSYAFPFRAGTRRVTIYDAAGRTVRQLAGEEPTGGTGTVIWDGRDDDGIVAPMGMYIVLVEARDAESGTVWSAKGVVVLAVRL